jgi:GWxTD domain-containing protein
MKYYLIANLFIPTLLVAQTLPDVRPFDVEADYARFRGSVNEKQYVEVYYSIPQKTLLYTTADGTMTAEAVLSLFVTKGDSVVVGQRWRVPHTRQDTAAIQNGINLIGVAGVELEAGDYRITVIGQDMHDLTRVDSVRMQCSILPLADGMVISDLELASVIRQGEKGGPFYKNTLDVVPNVTGIFDESQMCYLYGEAYNLLEGNDSSDYTQRLLVIDAVGREVISKERVRKRSAESTVIVESIPASKLKMGTYTIVLSFLGKSGSPLVSSSKKIFVYNPTSGIDSSLVAAAPTAFIDDYAGLSEEALDLEFDQARYEVNSREKDQYKKFVGREAKARFLAEFWAHKPLGFKEEYFRRVVYTNENFRSLGRKGYNTDRGRVYIFYGQPDDIERHPNEAEARPHELWTYNSLQGGVFFVFVQRSQGSDYQLVHSTHRNEIHDDNWERQIIVR